VSAPTSTNGATDPSPVDHDDLADAVAYDPLPVARLILL
jgi:hypothetical protein